MIGFPDEGRHIHLERTGYLFQGFKGRLNFIVFIARDVSVVDVGGIRESALAKTKTLTACLDRLTAMCEALHVLYCIQHTPCMSTGIDVVFPTALT